MKKVAFRLRRLVQPDSREPARALFLPGHDVAMLLRLCSRLQVAPDLYPVAGGFLLKLPEPMAADFPGTIRLRALAENLFVPADAELIPPLRPDEAAGLVRERGLVFLPGGAVLAFLPAAPLALSALLTVSGVQRHTWQPFPERPALAERLREITLELPPGPPEQVLEAGGADIGTEPPQPEETSPGARVAGSVKAAAGRGLMGLGKALGLRGLAQLGASWAQSALAQVPRLGESLHNAQEAALRALLKDFREGNLDRALRRALPLTGGGERGGTLARNARLPEHDPRYSLPSLLGSGSGPGNLWITGADLQRELEREYRKAAEQATRAGDHRRAAFIYGKLLGDYRRAAAMLEQGGLHHDAAILYLEKVGDTLAAARAFAAAGEIDRAVQLYRQRGEHLQAGDLLRRAGEEEAALVEYRAAADRLLLSPHRPDGGYLAAGELMLSRAARPDLARDYFARGWALRPEGNAVGCALRLAELQAGDEKPEPLLGLLREAEAFFEPPGNDVAAGQFFNAVARLADRDDLTPLREELRDRALMGLAHKLRQGALSAARTGNLPSALLGQSGAWPAALVTDARLALQAARRQPRPMPPSLPGPTQAMRVASGLVTAACFAPASGDIFLGLHNGGVVCFQPTSGRGLALPVRDRFSITALATDEAGQFLAVLEGSPAEESRYLSAYLRNTEGFYRVMEYRLVPGATWLTPLVMRGVGHPGAEDLVGLWEGSCLRLLRAPWLIEGEGLGVSIPDIDPTAGLLLPPPGPSPSQQPRYAVHLLGQLALLSYTPGARHQVQESYQPLGWTPATRPGSSLASAPLSWLQPDPGHLELAGLQADGTVCWSLIEFSADGRTSLVAGNLTRAGRYQAAALVGPRLIAAVGESQIDWLRCNAGGFRCTATTPVLVPAPLVCFPCFQTRELIVIGREGLMVRVLVPG